MDKKALELLTKCLMMTTSDQDGQILAAINRANALLAANGHTWYDVLGNQNPLTQDQIQKLYDAGYQDGYIAGEDAAKPRASWSDWAPISEEMELREILHLYDTLVKQGKPHGLDPRSDDYLNDLRDRLAIHGEDLHLSVKQQAWLNRIARRLRRAK